MLRWVKMPSICATAIPPDEGGGIPQTRHTLYSVQTGSRHFAR